MKPSSTKMWLREAHAEARRAQDDPERDDAFQAWKEEFLRASKSRSRKHKKPKDYSLPASLAEND